MSGALEVFRRGGIEVVEGRPGPKQELSALIREHRNTVDCVVLGGGDGTIQRAAAGCLDSGLPLGILPLGTANDLARTLGIPTDLVEAARLIVDGSVRRIDLSTANDVFFFNVAHIGLGARIRSTLSPEIKRRWGSLSYARALAQTFAERRPFRANVKQDDRVERVRSIQIAVGNGRYYGGGMTVSEDAEIEDGLLHVYSVAPVGFWKLLRTALPLMRGVANDPEAVQMLEARRLTIETDRPMQVVADGERITTTPVEFEVLPSAIPIYTNPHVKKEACDSKKPSGNRSQ